MGHPSLRALGLGKRYRLGRRREPYRTIRETIGNAARAPIRTAATLFRRSAPATIWALKDVSFEIGSGEVVGIIGKNGSGKTTLLKIISRITDPHEGEIAIWGRVRSLLEVGTGFHPELSGRENIYLNGAILGMRRAEIAQKFDEIVSFSEVETFLDTPVKYYSSGMYVRLAFAVAAHLESEILLVDEVLAVGDAAFQKKCLGKMEEASQSGRTVLFVSHNMPTVTRLCQRAILLNEGRVVLDGPAASVVGHYLSSVLISPAEQRWPDLQSAPGDECVRLRSIRVVDEHQRTVDNIDVRCSVGIELVFDIVEQKHAFVPTIFIKNEQEVAAFLALNTDSAWLEPRASGRYVTTAWIPPNLLNEGRMFVTVTLGTFTSGTRAIKRAVAFDVVAFQVVDVGEGGTARGNFVGTWTEPVRPLLAWTTSVEELTPGLDHVDASARMARSAK